MVTGRMRTRHPETKGRTRKRATLPLPAATESGVELHQTE